VASRFYDVKRKKGQKKAKTGSAFAFSDPALMRRLKQSA